MFLTGLSSAYALCLPCTVGIQVELASDNAANKVKAIFSIALMRKRKDDEFYLYFIVRSILMGLMGATIFSVIIWLLKTSRLPSVLSISAGSFFIVLFLTRVFDAQIRSLVEIILDQLEKHPAARNFILNHF
jgi:hypothetical protein